MTFIVIKYGEGERMLVNADCMVGVLLNYVLQRLAPAPPPTDWLLELCDERGVPQLLWALPEHVRALEAVQPRRQYSALLRRRHKPDAMFAPAAGGQLPADQLQLVARTELLLRLALAQLPEQPAAAADAGQLLQLVLQARRGELSDAALRGQLARLPREAAAADSERLAALEQHVQARAQLAGRVTRLGQLAGRMRVLGQAQRRRVAARSRSNLSNRSIRSVRSSSSRSDKS